MSAREFVFDNLIGDLEYHPKRALVYFALAAASLAAVFIAGEESRFTAIPIACAGGGLILLLKGVFLLRKSSDGLESSSQSLGLVQPVVTRNTGPKPFPSTSAIAAQIIQDFGTGTLLLTPVMRLAENVNDGWRGLPRAEVLFIGAALFGTGWLIRKVAAMIAPTVTSAPN